MILKFVIHVGATTVFLSKLIINLSKKDSLNLLHLIV